MATVVILIEPYDVAIWKLHLMSVLVPRWVDAKHRCILHAGPDKLPAADLAFLHVDLSVVPQEYLDAMKRYPIAVNGSIADIRKRAHSVNLVARGDPYAGRVIVKSDLNSGGKPEVGKRNMARSLGKLNGPMEDPAESQYRVYDSPAEVPAAVWDDPALVVEKFLPEQEGDTYLLRYYYFLGDAEANLVLRSREPIVKAVNTYRVDFEPPPPEIRALRRKLGFGYGKFDYVLRDGRVVLFDANRTPSHSLLLRQRLVEPVVNRLAPGLESLLQPAA